MKKQYTIAALSLAAAVALTGCSLGELKAKFVGEKSISGSAITIDGPVEIEEYDITKCVTLADYKGVEVDCSASDEEVQADLDALLKQNATEKKKEKGTAKKGDTVNIDFDGKLDGTTAFDGGSAEDYSLDLGSDTFIDGFEDGVIGMKVGETKDIKLKFPDPYPNNPELVGKDVTFTVTLNYITTYDLPKLTDKFIKKATESEYKTVKEYKEGMKKEIIQQKKASAPETALSTIVANSTVNSVPATLVTAIRGQIDAYNRYYLSAYYGSDISFETLLGSMNMTQEQYESQLTLMTEQNARTVLVIEAIAAKEGITVSEEEVTATLNSTVSNAGVSSAEELYQQYETMYGKSIPCEDNLKSSLLDQKVMELIENTMVLK